VKQVIKDTAAVISFPIVIDGNFQPPDVGSVSYTLFDNAGAAVAGHTNVNVTVDGVQTTVNVTIAGAQNGKTLITEYRSVVLSFQVGTVPYALTQRYIITDFLPHAVTQDDVRGLLGVSHEELPDHNIDLVAAYFELGNSVGLSGLSAALGAGGRTAHVANRGVAAQAALLALPGLKLRINQMEKSDADSFQRFAKIDWQQIADDLAALVTAASDVVNPADTENGTYITVNTPIDPVTGA
jgi:hypothetical protein